MVDRARLEQRKRDDHARILAARAQRAMAPPESWWARPNVTWQQWSALADEAQQRMNAVTTTYRKAEERS